MEDSEGKGLLVNSSMESAVANSDDVSSPDTAPLDVYGIPKRKAGVFGTCLNLAQNTMGAGSLGIASAFGGAGLGGGLLVMGITVCIAFATLLILSWLSTRLKEHSIQGLINVTKGKRFGIVCQTLILVTQFGACVLYLQVVRDSLSLTFQHWFSVHWYTDPRFLLFFWSLVIISPMCFMRQISHLSYGSFLGVTFICYTVFFVVIEAAFFLRDNPVPASVVWGVAPSIRVALAFPIFLFSLSCHVGFVPIVAELVDPSLPRVVFSLSSSLATALSLYAAIGVAGYLRFGANVPSNILNAYNPSSVPAIVARLGIACALSVSYPILTFVGRLTFATLFLKRRQSSHIFFHVFFTCLWIGASYGVAAAVTNIGVVFSVLGSTTGVTFVFIVPMLMIQASFPQNKVLLVTTIISIVLGVAVGVLAITTQFIS